MKNFFSALLYYVVVFPLSKLPFFVVYGISNGIAFILEYLIAYRKKVIDRNLLASFPDKTDAERLQIRKDFYKHFADVLMETLKAVSWTKEDAQKRVVYENTEALQAFYKEGKSILLVLGHFGNWEWFGASFPMVVAHKALGIYKPLKNEFFDKKVKATRAKFGLELVPMKDSAKRIKATGEKPKMTMLITDQSPSNPKRAYWTTFLNQDTGVLFGAEKFAQIYDMPVVYMSISKLKRGFYKVKFETLFATPKETQLGEITTAHTKALEKDIIMHPELWLWSHKRWKHQKPKVTR